MNTKQTEALKLALEALKQIDEAMPFPVAKLAQKVIREALAEQPAQRKPLTDEELAKVAAPFAWENLNTVEICNAFARAVEAAHGIKGNA